MLLVRVMCVCVHVCMCGCLYVRIYLSVGAGEGMGGGLVARRRTHFLEPDSVAFQADVAFGSTWKLEPDLAGPTISHRQSGRPSPSTLNRSSEKCCGVFRSAASSGIVRSKCLSNRYSGASSYVPTDRMYDTYSPNVIV